MAGLRPTNTLSRQERTELSRKGGKRSQEVQRQKKQQRQILIELLSMKAPVATINAVADVLNNARNIDNEEAILASIVKQARDNGSLNAAIFIRDTIGEAPTSKVDHTSDGNPMCVAIVPDKKSLDEWIKSQECE